MKYLSVSLAVLMTAALTTPGQGQDNPGWLQGKVSPAAAASWLAQPRAARAAAPSEARNTEPLSDLEAATSLGQSVVPSLSAPATKSFALMAITAGGNEADEVTPEIEALARGLRNDPVKIFEYVHNFIRYEAYFGSKKGAHLTLLEGSGNEHDQCALLVSLLRAAGLSPSYKYGPCTFSYSQMAKWLGISTSPFSHWTDAQLLAYYYPAGGAPSGFPTAAHREFLTIYEFLTPRGYPKVDVFRQLGVTYFSIPHVWVELGGKVISPSYKYQTIRSGIDLAAATGYSRSQILADAGGAVNTGDGARWVSGLNYSALSSRLATQTQNFIQAVKANHDERASQEMTESTTINMETYANLDPWSASNPDGIKSIFPDTVAASSWLPFETWTAIPTAHMSKLEIRAGIWNGTTWTSTYFNLATPLNLSGLRGRKLSLTFSGNTGRIYLDETLVGTTFSIPSGVNEFDLRVGINHNHYELTGNNFAVTDLGKSNQSETKKYLKGDDCAYALIYSFGNPDRLSRARQEQLDAYRRAGLADTDWRVRTESLNIMGLNWLHQCHLAEQAIAGLFNMVPLNHHKFGRVGQERSFSSGAISFYIDVGLILSAHNHRTTNFTEDTNCTRLTNTFASAMEHGVLEQMQGTNLGATSTVKMAYLANQAGQRLYRATKANWTTVNSELSTDWLSSVKATVGAALNADSSSRALMPHSGKLVLNQYSGFGYALEEPTRISMLIGSNYGGYNSKPGAVSTSDLLAWLKSDPSYLYKSSTLAIPAAPHTTPAHTFGDPVDVATGAWVSDVTDLTLGGSDTAGLHFTRSYNSNSAYNNAPGLGFGWTHNYDITATTRSSMKAGLGATTSYQAAPFFAALAAAADLSRNHATAKEWATAALVIHWAVDQLRYKAVAITIGNKTLEFIEMPDGSFIPPAGMNLTLVRNGSGASAYFTLTQRHGSTMTFRTDGKIGSITDLHGKTQQFAYLSGKLSSVTEAFGRSLTFNWSGNKISSVADSTGRSVTFGYSGDDLTTTTDAEGKASTYTYDTAHRVTSVKDPENRIVVENDYDSKGRVITQRNKGEAARTYNLFYSGYCNMEENPLGGAIAHYYDSRGRAIGSKNALGQSDSTAYDGQDRRITHFSAKNEIIDWYYNAENNLTREWDQRGFSAYYYYDTALRLQRITDKRGKDTTYTYTAKHQPQTVTDHLGNITSYTYQTNGLPATVTDAEGKITTMAYDAWGNVNRISAYDGTFQTFTHNARSDALTATDAEGRTTTHTYNKRRQPLTTTLPAVPGEAAAVVTSTYDNSGNLQSTTDAKGNVTSHTYNTEAQHISTTLPALPAGNNVLTTGYDVRDWATSSTNSLGHTSTISYDAAKRPNASTDPLNRRSETTFDANGQPTEVKDPLDRSTTFTWNSRGEKTRTTNALTHYSNSTLDANGNQTLLRNRRAKNYTFAFDNANRPISTTTPTGKVTSMTYWKNHLAKTITEPSTQTTTLAYNGKNLVSSKTDPTGSISYTYDNRGLLTTVTEGTSVITRTYDERSRIKTYTNADGDLIQYSYDSNNNLTRLTYPDGKQVNYTYNARNLLATVTDWNNRITTYQYDRLGRLIGTTRPNGTANIISHDAASQLTSIKETANGKLISYLKFDYDAASQITRRFRAPLVNSGWQHPTFAATYDDDNRLATLNSQTVTHDADGNMTQAVLPSSLASQSLVSWVLSYNSRNQLTQAAGSSYTYDAEGHRRTLTDSGGTTRDTIDPSGSLSRLLIRTHPGGTKTYYVYGLGLLYEVDQAGKTKTHHYDQVGSTIARTDDTGKVIGKAEYSAFGITFWKQGDMATPFLYNGQAGVQTDPNGLLNMRARYYSPYLMSFLNADPIGFSGGMNWFAYADGNPISMSDPFGLDAIFFYGDNDRGGGDRNFFKPHAEVQAANFTQNHRPIIGYETLPAPHSPGPIVAVYGEPTERAYVMPGRNATEWNEGLNSVQNISNVTYNGHSGGLGTAFGLESIGRGNLNSNATICLNGCNTGVDDNRSGNFSAQRFADHFNVKVRGITEGLSFGLPVPHVISTGYTDIAPGKLRGAGSLSDPGIMWASPRSSNKSSNK